MMKPHSVNFFLLMAAISYGQQPIVQMSRSQGRVIVCAHRGRTKATQLENSVTVMRTTVSQGVPMVELDLHESLDHVIFLLHDQTLNRTTDATGSIAKYTSEQLKHVYLRDPVTGELREPISSFEDLLAMAQTSPALLMVDLKNTPPRDAVAELRRYKLLDRAVLLTFDDPTAKEALASDPSVWVSVLAKSPQQVDAMLKIARKHPLAFYVPQTADPALFDYAHHCGALVITDALGTLDSQAESGGVNVYMRYLAAHRADVLVTNDALTIVSPHQQDQ